MEAPLISTEDSCRHYSFLVETHDLEDHDGQSIFISNSFRRLGRNINGTSELFWHTIRNRPEVCSAPSTSFSAPCTKKSEAPICPPNQVATFHPITSKLQIGSLHLLFIQLLIALETQQLNRVMTTINITQKYRFSFL